MMDKIEAMSDKQLVAAELGAEKLQVRLILVTVLFLVLAIWFDYRWALMALLSGSVALLMAYLETECTAQIKKRGLLDQRNAFRAEIDRLKKEQRDGK